MDRPSRTPAGFAATVGIDLLAVIVFVLIGRASHGEGILGLLVTLWPFAVGLLVGHVLALVLGQRETRSVRWAGVVVWVSTVVVGMVLRAVSGQGVQLSFVIVTVLVLAALLLGWRFVAWLIARRRR
ncbi:DUF3054 domain-containing protein [Plantibacter sp. VKM Ac-2885]|uniref:DUF3054 domain-containing protein n=1 Tax=Plantibacter cousiniae (nom. nud.) TaxID=199709 RepID=A0ABY1LN19_9MICO|nr:MULTISPECIES: DUF3054 domain-containing protein [Plantibacter]MBD8104541.1 DUF3054 domain-containing protein [Plantibacter sp. CFBP 8775]MBD8517770.1 DUF3054 domain-containing protein [Plantibacter sp. CFBP 8804]MBF4513473.1 DUF3054 domain-containing protein [Plantibacter sp. VKM Ac-2885]MBF4566011.1 DUF3054 domain-containing protein [Plantibacter sp. VKM Ac-2876]OAN31253.1 hypothetical protein A4X17_17510 [Plantibacter sp. H53]